MRSFDRPRTAPAPGKNTTVLSGGCTFFGRKTKADMRSSSYAVRKLTFSRLHAESSWVDSTCASSGRGSYAYIARNALYTSSGTGLMLVASRMGELIGLVNVSD